MATIRETLAAWHLTVWAWLMRNALTVFAVVLFSLALSVLFSGKKSQDAKEAVVQAVSEGKQAQREVQRKEVVLARQLDSIRTQTIIIRQVVHVRDSAVVAARYHEARADSLLLNSLPDEDFTAPSTAAAHVERFLTGYRPGAYARPAGDSLK